MWGVRSGRGECEGGGERVGIKARQRLKVGIGSVGEGCGVGGVAVRCIDITQNPDCDGIVPVHN